MKPHEGKHETRKGENMNPHEGKHETRKGENMKPYQGKHETPKSPMRFSKMASRVSHTLTVSISELTHSALFDLI